MMGKAEASYSQDAVCLVHDLISVGCRGGGGCTVANAPFRGRIAARLLDVAARAAREKQKKT